MNFNLLPNEILLTVFDCLKGNSLLYTFYGLNARINALLYKQYYRYYFNFSILFKHRFDLICQQHIPLIADHILAIHLSDSESNPGQINLFFSYIPSLRQFTQLRSLSLSYLRSKEILLKVAIELPHLVQLTHLKFYSCCIPDYDETDFELLTNNIWNLPNLTHCYFNIRHKTRQRSFILPSKISSSLKYLSIGTEKLNLNSINRLFQYTPNLKYLHGYIDCLKNGDDYIRSSFSTLTSLNIFIAEALPSEIISFLQNTPNLHRLNISIRGSYFIDGYQWADLIRHYLPKLRTFHLSMSDLSRIRLMTEEQIDELMNSFRTSFWIDEHRWFIRCISDGHYIRFETVSKAFHYIGMKLPIVFKSTDSQDTIERLYSSIGRISDVELSNQPISSKIYFPNIDSLSVKCPINDQYWSMIPNLHKVSLLSLDFSIDLLQSELQALLNRMPHLRTLIVHQDTSLPLPISFFNCTFPSSIRYLYLQECKHYFNEEDCIILCHSSLTNQCQQLDILVQNRQSIMILMNNMINLCALRARFTDEEASDYMPSRIHNNVDDESILCKDEDIQWLIEHLPSTCAISRHPFCVNHLRIWIK